MGPCHGSFQVIAGEEGGIRLHVLALVELGVVIGAYGESGVLPVVDAGQHLFVAQVQIVEGHCFQLAVEEGELHHLVVGIEEAATRIRSAGE